MKENRNHNSPKKQHKSRLPFVFCFLLGSLLGATSCTKTATEPIDLTPKIEVPPVLTPDSPVWKQLSSPSTFNFNDGAIRTNPATMYTGVMWRQDTLNDTKAVDDFSVIKVIGNSDGNLIAAGNYDPQSGRWVLSLTPGLPRYSPMLLGVFAITGRFGVVNYFSLLGSGYTVNENFPNGISYVSDIWMQENYETKEKIKENVLLTGFMANNSGYFFENDSQKQFWTINNSQIYSKRTTFPGQFISNIACASAKINDRDFGFVISESSNKAIKTRDFYQYDTQTDKWTKRADFPGEDRQEGQFFGISGKIYYGLGQSKTEAKGFRDIWQYDPTTNRWTQFATYPGGGNVKLVMGLVSGKAYIGMGYQVAKTAIGTEKYVGALDFWEFVPSRK